MVTICKEYVHLPASNDLTSLFLLLGVIIYVNFICIGGRIVSFTFIDYHDSYYCHHYHHPNHHPNHNRHHHNYE